MNNCFGGNCSWIIIILILLFCCGGCGSNGTTYVADNSCGCGCGCERNRCCD